MKTNNVECVEDLMEKIFEAIRKETFATKEKKASYKPTFNEDKTQVNGKKSSYKRNVRLTLEQRKERIQKKIAAAEDNLKLLQQNQ